MQKPYTLTQHGHSRVDPFYWLRDRNSDQTRDYLDAENRYTETQLADVESLREALYREIRSRLREDDESAPYRDGDFWYSTRYRSGHEYPQYVRRHNSHETPDVILDVQTMAKGHDFYSVRGLALSPDHRRLAFFVDTTGRRQYSLNIRDLETGEVLDTRFGDLAAGAEWSSDGRYLFVVRNDPETLRSRSVCVYDTQTGDVSEIFDETDEAYSVYIDKTRSEEFILLVSVCTVATEVRVLPAAEPHDTPSCFMPRERDHEYFVDHDGDKFLVLTNRGARNFELVAFSDMAADAATTLLAHDEDALIEDFTVFEQFIVAERMRSGLSELLVIDRESGEQHSIEFNDPAYSVSVGDNRIYATDVLRFEYESMTTPASVVDYHMRSRDREVVKCDEVLGDFDHKDYICERFFVAARDSTEVPVSLVRRRDVTDAAPLLLYAYGAYGYSTEPGFSYSRLSLLDRGFCFAIAHVRGGSDLGRDWYEQGKLENKWNTFNDFIDVGRYLVSTGVTRSDRLYAMGGSAGGLLMGVVLNTVPDLFAGVIAAVPFVDVVTTMLDTSIPLTTGEFDEWGNPAVEDDYYYILSYSPYDNVRDVDYPPVLVTCGLHDSQVQYWEPAKWVARLRTVACPQPMILLHTNMEAGHGGPSGRFDAIRETALEYAFLLKLERQRETA